MNNMKRYLEARNKTEEKIKKKLQEKGKLAGKLEKEN